MSSTKFSEVGGADIAYYEESSRSFHEAIEQDFDGKLVNRSYHQFDNEHYVPNTIKKDDTIKCVFIKDTDEKIPDGYAGVNIEPMMSYNISYFQEKATLSRRVYGALGGGGLVSRNSVDFDPQTGRGIVKFDSTNNPMYGKLLELKPGVLRFFADRYYPWRKAVQPFYNWTTWRTSPENIKKSRPFHITPGSRTVKPMWFGPVEFYQLLQALKNDGVSHVKALITLPVMWRYWITNPPKSFSQASYYPNSSASGLDYQRTSWEDYFLGDDVNTLIQYWCNFLEFCNAPSPVPEGEDPTEWARNNTGWLETSWKFTVFRTDDVNDSSLDQVQGKNPLPLDISLTADFKTWEFVDLGGGQFGIKTEEFEQGDLFVYPPCGALFRARRYFKVEAGTSSRAKITIRNDSNQDVVSDYTYDHALLPGFKWVTNLPSGYSPIPWWEMMDWVDLMEVYAEGDEEHNRQPRSWKAWDKAPKQYFSWLRHKLWGIREPFKFEFWELGNEIDAFVGPVGLSNLFTKAADALKNVYEGADREIKIVGSQHTMLLNFPAASKVIYNVDTPHSIAAGASYKGVKEKLDYFAPHYYYLPHPATKYVWGEHRSYMYYINKKYDPTYRKFENKGVLVPYQSGDIASSSLFESMDGSPAKFRPTGMVFRCVSPVYGLSSRDTEIKLYPDLPLYYPLTSRRITPEDYVSSREQFIKSPYTVSEGSSKWGGYFKKLDYVPEGHIINLNKSNFMGEQSVSTGDRTVWRCTRPYRYDRFGVQNTYRNEGDSLLASFTSGTGGFTSFTLKNLGSDFGGCWEKITSIFSAKTQEDALFLRQGLLKYIGFEMEKIKHFSGEKRHILGECSVGSSITGRMIDKNPDVDFRPSYSMANAIAYADFVLNFMEHYPVYEYASFYFFSQTVWFKYYFSSLITFDLAKSNDTDMITINPSYYSLKLINEFASGGVKLKSYNVYTNMNDYVSVHAFYKNSNVNVFVLNYNPSHDCNVHLKFPNFSIRGNTYTSYLLKSNKTSGTDFEKMWAINEITNYSPVNINVTAPSPETGNVAYSGDGYLTFTAPKASVNVFSIPVS